MSGVRASADLKCRLLATDYTEACRQPDNDHHHLESVTLTHGQPVKVTQNRTDVVLMIPEY